jgi:hypothetical protein
MVPSLGTARAAVGGGGPAAGGTAVAGPSGGRAQRRPGPAAAGPSGGRAQRRPGPAVAGPSGGRAQRRPGPAAAGPSVGRAQRRGLEARSPATAQPGDSRGCARGFRYPVTSTAGTCPGRLRVPRFPAISSGKCTGRASASGSLPLTTALPAVSPPDHRSRSGSGSVGKRGPEEDQVDRYTRRMRPDSAAHRATILREGAAGAGGRARGPVRVGS